MKVDEIPLRMTAAGHEYIDDLNEEGVWEKIRKDFKHSSVETIKLVSKEIIKGVVKTKIEPYLKSS